MKNLKMNLVTHLLVTQAQVAAMKAVAAAVAAAAAREVAAKDQLKIENQY